MLYILPRTLCIVSEHVVIEWCKGSVENKHLMDMHVLHCDPAYLCALFAHCNVHGVFLSPPVLFVQRFQVPASSV
jgi:hypothetical protein